MVLATSAVVNNVAPTPTGLSLSSSTVAVGQPVTLSGKITDPGILDGESAVVTWGDGTKSTVTVDPATRTFSIAHIYGSTTGASQSFPIVVTATDSDGGVGSASLSVAVTASAPRLASLAFTPSTVNEGSVATLAGTIAGLPVADAATVAIVWGDGTTQSVSLAAGMTSFSINHTFLDNPTGQPTNGSFSASATLTDLQSTLSASASASVTVNNVAPVITSFTNASASTNKTPIGQAMAYSLVFTDPGALDTHTVTIGWGDGSQASTYTVAAGQLTFNPTHTYAKTGTFYVTVALVDKDGASAAGKATVAYVGGVPTAAAFATTATPTTTATTTATPTTTATAATTPATTPATATATPTTTSATYSSMAASSLATTSSATATPAVTTSSASAAPIKVKTAAATQATPKVTAASGSKPGQQGFADPRGPGHRQERCRHDPLAQDPGHPDREPAARHASRAARAAIVRRGWRAGGQRHCRKTAMRARRPCSRTRSGSCSDCQLLTPSPIPSSKGNDPCPRP